MMKTRPLASAAALILVLISSNAWTQAAPVPTPATPAADAAEPVVKTEQGKVKGVIVNGVAVFRGLPFAAPPIGDLRWRAPKQPAKWSDVRVADTFSST